MNRVELEKMTGKELIVYADKLGVKVNCNKERTGLKESKAKAIDKIVTFEEAKEASGVKEVKETVKVEEVNEVSKSADVAQKVAKNVDKTQNDLIEIFENFGYELKRTNRKNAETYTFKFNKITVEVCSNKKGITLYCSKNIFTNSVNVGNKFKVTNIDVYNLNSIIKEV